MTEHNTINNTFYIKYDNNGNIYMCFNNCDYWLYIDKNDDINIDKLNKIIKVDEIDEDKNNNKKITKNFLRSETINQLITDYDNDVEQRNDEDEEYITSINTFKLCPEEKYTLLDEKKIDDYDNLYLDDVYDVYSDVYYDIYNNTCDNTCDNYNIKIVKHDNIFGISNYECIVFNGDLTSTDIIFRTDIINDSPSYRIMIYNKCIKLNIIGSVIKTYEIVFNSSDNGDNSDDIKFKKIYSEHVYD